MPNLRVIVTRRQTVRNIHKITRTMNLIATSRFRKTHDRVVATRPYAERIAALVRQLAEVADGRIEHPLLAQRQVRTDLLLVLTSNRGLCGGYNAAVLRAAVEHHRAAEAQHRQVRLEIVGKKGAAYVRFLGLPIEAAYTHIGDRPKYSDVEQLARRYIELFCVQATDAVHVAYTRFISAGVQEAVVAQVLPLVDLPAGPGVALNRAAQAKPAGGIRHAFDDYDFLPGPADLLADLLPIHVKTMLFRFFNDAAVSEQVARMRAMKAATDNAEDMIKLLTRQYNRARQSRITSELSEIMGGAAAIE